MTVNKYEKWQNGVKLMNQLINSDPSNAYLLNMYWREEN